MKNILTLIIIVLFLLTILPLNINIASGLNLVINPTDDTYVYVETPTGTGQNVNYNGQNLSIGSYYTNAFSRAYLMFNISQLNVEGYATSVQNAEFSIYIKGDFYQGGYEPDVVANLSVYEVYPPLNESNLTWNNQFCGGSFTNSANCNLTKMDYIPYPRGVSYPHTPTFPNWSYWDVTTLIQRKVESNKVTLAIWLENDTTELTMCGTGDGSGCRVYAYDTENSITKAPTLNITYTLTPYFETSLIFPEDNTQTKSNLINYTANLSCFYGCENSTLYFENSTGSIVYNIFTDLTGISQILLGNEANLSSNLENGNYIWYYDVYDTVGNLEITENRTIIVNVTQERIPPEETEIYQQMAGAGAGLGLFANNIAIPLMNFLLVEFLIILIVVIVIIAIAHSLRLYATHLSQPELIR